MANAIHQPGELIEVSGHTWRVRGVHLGSLKSESLIEIENVSHESGWTGEWEYHPVMYVPEVLFRAAMKCGSDGSREAGETAGLDPKDDSAVGNAETPNPPPSGDIGELVRVATPAEEIGGFLATIAAQAARIETQAAEIERLKDREKRALALAKRHMTEKHKAQAQAKEDWDLLQSRIAELEKERDEARYELLLHKVSNKTPVSDHQMKRLLEQADFSLLSRLSDAVKVIEEIAALDYTQAATNLCATKANRLARAFLSTTGGDSQ